MDNHDDILKQAWEIAQLAKELQNTEHRWTEEGWRKISKAIENVENILMEMSSG